MLVFVGCFAYAYRYTISPKAGQCLQEANRRYEPWIVEKPDWVLFLKVYGAFVVGGTLLSLVLESRWPDLVVLPGSLIVIKVIQGYRARRDRRER